MRKLVFVAYVAWVATSSWAQSSKEAKPETLARWSFAGTKELAANKNLQVFSKIRELPESAAMRDVIATNLANLIASRYGGAGPSNAPVRVKIPSLGENPVPMPDGIAALIQPLFADLVQNESRFQMDSISERDADWMLAVKLPEDRVGTWSKHLAQLSLLTGMKGAVENQASWLATRDAYKLSLSRSKDWTILQGGISGADSKGGKAFRDALSKSRGKDVLDAVINTPTLATIWKVPGLAHYPKLTVNAEPRGDGLQSEMILEYPQDLGIKPEKWNVPDEIIQEPLVGFTAIQGLQAKLTANERFKALGAKQIPNQLFLWAQGMGPFSVHAAAEVKNPAEVVTNAARAFQRLIPGAQPQLATNRAAVTWLGLPIATPFLQAAAAPNGSFLIGGLFPASVPEPQPIPKELLEQLKQKDLVYYDWEITGERLRQWMPTWDLYYLVMMQMTPNGGAPSTKFIQALRRQIGNTITAGFLEKPNRIKFTRQSHIGFTALELVLLSHYLDSTDLRANRAGAPGTLPVPAPR